MSDRELILRLDVEPSFPSWRPPRWRFTSGVMLFAGVPAPCSLSYHHIRFPYFYHVFNLNKTFRITVAMEGASDPLRICRRYPAALYVELSSLKRDASGGESGVGGVGIFSPPLGVQRPAAVMQQVLTARATSVVDIGEGVGHTTPYDLPGTLSKSWLRVFSQTALESCLYHSTPPLLQAAARERS